MNEEKDIYILGIETSCDETAAAIVKNGREVLSNVIYSQIDLHTVYGGVVPEIASRKHVEKIDMIVKKAISDAAITKDRIDAIAVTYGPGLVGALLVGVAYAKSYAYALEKPLVGVNHIEGHVCANYITDKYLEPPFICLIVSGGHSHIVVMEDYDRFKVIGRTRDDAAGEAYDKIARSVGLGYPGGPKIDAVAKEGNPEAYAFPRAKIDGAPYDFSFSGLKSAVLNQINSARMASEQINVADVVASFQQAVVDVLVTHTVEAAVEHGFKDVALAGGVASNSALRSAMQNECDKRDLHLHIPSPIYCTDNAAMIGCAGYYEYLKGNIANLSLNAVPGLKLGERIERC